MSQVKEVKDIDLEQMNKIVVVDRAYDDDGRNGHWEDERTVLYESRDIFSANEKVRFYVARYYVNETFDDEFVLDITPVFEKCTTKKELEDALEEYIDLKTSKEFYEDSLNHFRRTWHDRRWRIRYEGYTQEEYEDLYPERPIEL